jgi:L-lactate dehydrogenase complex protein LldG
MSSAREHILGRLRAVPRGSNAVPPVACPELVEGPTFAADTPLTLDEAIARFRAGIELFHAEVIDTRSGDWRTTLAEQCAVKQVRRLLLPPALDLPAWPGGPTLRHFDRPIESFKRDLFDAIDAGLTIADGAIAETGTLFQIDPRTTPRTLSLVPPIHFCVLDVARILPTLASAVAAQGWQAAMPSNLIFITGPSKTADIQQTLAYGAHGPKELIVLLTDGGNGGVQ